MPEPSEVERIRERYARRKTAVATDRYDRLRPDVIAGLQDKQRALARWARTSGMRPLGARTLIDIGCGHGDDLGYFISLGFDPGRLTGVELLEERAGAARVRLPAATRIISGDAAALENLGAGEYDVVFQSTVFTSILDDAFAERLAQQMWSLAKPGGGVLWNDFIYNNPRNPDVRGYGLRRIRRLFPQAKMRYWRTELAPPINRLITRVHPGLYGIANALPFLRVHVLCWLQKPA